MTRTEIELLENEDFLSSFDLIVFTEVDAPTLVSSFYHLGAVEVEGRILIVSIQLRMNALTRKLGKKLFAASSIGIDGWIFADLFEHEFVVCVSKIPLFISQISTHFFFST